MVLPVAFLRVPGVCVKESVYLHSCSFCHGGLSKLSYLSSEKKKKKKKQNKAVEGGIFLVFFFFFENIVGTDTLKISYYLHMILYLWSRPYPAPSLEMYSSMLWSSIKIENQFEQVRDTSWRSRGGLNLEELSGILGCNVAHLPLKCLGLFLGAQFKSKII